MAELNIRINTQQAEQSGAKFKSIIDQIKDTVRSLDQLAMSRVINNMQFLTTSAAGSLKMIQQVTMALGTMNYTLQSIRSADYGSKLASDFSKVRDMVRETRAELAGLNTGLREAVNLAGRMGTAATRVRSARAAPAAGGGAPVAEAGAAPMSTALVVRQDSQYLAMAQERARIVAQVSAQEAQARQTEMQAQAAMLAQVQAYQQARVAAANATAVAEEAAAASSMQARIAAERAVQVAFEQTQAQRRQEGAATTAFEEAERQKEIQSAGATYMRLRAFQQEHVQNVQNAAREEMAAIERTMQARLRAAEQFRVVDRQQRLALPPGRTDQEAASLFAGRAFDLSQRSRVQIPERAGPSAYAEGVFGAGGPEATRKVFGGFEEVNKTMEKTSGALKNTKEHKDRLDKNLKDTAQNTLPKFNSAWLVTLGYFALFNTRRIIDELTDLGKSLFNTGVEFEKAFAIMKAGAGDNAEEGARRMQVAADLARKLGLDLTQLVVDYGKVAAAAKGSDIEGALTEEMIKNLGSAMAVFGQNTEKGSGLIKVFTDVLSKGRLQSEELVKQLGNAVPGAFRVVAESIGMTTTQLQDAVAKGSVSATGVLVKLAAELNKIYGAEALKNLDRLSGAFNNLKQSITEVALLIVNVSTGIMQGGGGTFGKALIDSFKQLSDLLQRRDIQTHIVELANFITNILAAAFQGLIVVLQFVAEHMQFFIGLVTALTSTSIVAGVAALALAFKGLFLAFIGFVATGPGAVIMLAGLAASLLLGAKAAEFFGKASEGVAESMKKMFDDIDKRRAQQASGNTNPADQTRAVQQALNSVEAEQRRFVEGVRSEAQMLELSASGVSTLSARYEAYLNVLERIKAKEVKDLFTILSPQDAATMKQRLTEALLVAETVKQAVGDIVEMFKSLDQAQEGFATQAATAMADLRSMQEGTFSELGSRIQEQYDQKVIPVMRRVREELRSIADPNLRNTLVGAFNAWSVAMRDNIVHIEKLKDQMAGVTDITKQLRDFRFQSMLADTAATVRAGAQFVDTTIDDISSTIDSMRKEGFFPDLAPPKIRTLGDELKEGFNPQDVGKEMGRSFTEVFVQAMEASVQKLIDQMKVLAIVPPQAQPSGSTGTGGGGTMAQAPQEIEAYITEANRQFPQVRKDLIRAVMLQESSFSPQATGRAGEIGLMQLKAGTAKDLGVDPYNNLQNVIGGTKYIAQHLIRYGGDEARALAAYNRGPGAVPIQGPVPEKGQQYAQQVLGRIPGGTATTAVIAAAPTAPATTAAAAAPAGPVTPDAAIVRDVGRLLGWAWGKVTAPDTPKTFGPAFGAPEQKRYVPGEPPTPPAPAYTVNPTMYPQPIGPPAKTAEQIAEETKRINEQFEAIKKRTQAEQDGAAQADKVAKEMEQRRAQQEATAKAVQEQLDRKTAQLTKEIDLLKNVGTVEMSNESIDERKRAGLQKAKELYDRYNAATNEHLEQMALLGEAQYVKEAIAKANEYSLSLEKQTKALNDETDALIRNRHESSLTAEASAAFRQREKERLEGGRAFGPDEEARRAQASRDAMRAQVRSTVESTLTGSEKERRDLQMEIDSLQDNTIERAANLEMRRRNAEQLANAANMLPEEIRRIREANEAIRQTRINLQLANGPLRQYIDSLADFSSEASISTAMQERFAELFQGMEDSIISFTKTGKFNFSELADSFIESIQRMVLQALIFRPIAEALNQALSPGGGAAPGTDFPGASGGGGGKTNWISTVFGLVKTGVGIYTGNPAIATSGATQTIGGFTGGDMPGAATGGWVTEHGIQRFQGGGMARIGTDTVPAMLTPGEMVLNREQQANVFGKKTEQQNNTFNMVFPNVSNEDQARKTAAQAYSEMSSRLERQRVRDGIRTRK